MFLTFHFLQHLAAELATKLTGSRLFCCFSQTKDELVIGFSNDRSEGFYIKALLSPQVTLLSFGEEFHRAKKNSVDIFHDVIGVSVLDVIQFENERSFSIVLAEGYMLLFKMHGQRANILLVREDKVEALFNNQLIRDQSIDPSDLHRSIDQSFNAFEQAEGDIKALFPTFDKRIRQYIAHNLPETDDLGKQYEFLEKVRIELDEPVFYIMRDGDEPYISLLKSAGEVIEEFHSAIEVLNRFHYLFTRDYYLTLEKRRLLSAIQDKIKKGDRYLKKTTSRFQTLEKQRDEQEIANLIMANLHQIPSGASEVSLYDFYTDQTIDVTLKSNLTAQKNAEIYYRKGKNKTIELDILRKNIRHKEEELSFLNAEMERVGSTSSIKSLRKENKQINKNEKQGLKPYVAFSHMGYDIFVGRNAKQNDVLTLKVAKKDDLWLHAKDVAGSHVVIKSHAGQGFPNAVIEAAAQLAAYYSKRKTDSFCPVIYTPKKYVRKVKGAKPGAVMVDKEKVIIVQPQRLT